MEYILKLMELLVNMEPELYEVLIISIGGPTVGGLLGYYFSRYKTSAEADQIRAMALKVKAETDQLELETNIATIKHYATIIDQLQININNHNAQIADLDKKLNASFDEKRRLSNENMELRSKLNAQDSKISQQEKEIVILRMDVKALRERQGDCDASSV